MASAPEPETPRPPLTFPVFRALWIATVVSNIGAWMHDVGAGWLMTTLSSSPIMVALVQTAATLPVFLLGLPAGALADIVDRRRLLLIAQALGIAGATLLAGLTWAGHATPLLLLAATLLLGVSAALSAPVFQAIVPELVARPSLPDAVALNSLGVNVSRAVGPALGGAVVALAGPAAVFAANAASSLAVVVVIWRWRRLPVPAPLPAETFAGALRAGLRYVRGSPELRIVLVRSVAFFVCGSALWAMLPLLARRGLGLEAAGYGLLLAGMGVGAVAGALLLPRLRRRASVNTLSMFATLTFAVASIGLALAPGFAAALMATVLAGLGWIVMLTSLNVAAQMAAPAWVKARTLSVYLVVFQGAMTAGSVLWGVLASQSNIVAALVWAGAGHLAGLVLALHWHLPGGRGPDLSPSRHWAAPQTGPLPPGDDDGPVMVQIEYRIDPDLITEFSGILERFGERRRRDGAVQWNAWIDAAEPTRVVETFVVETWLEHRRQHERATQADRVEQERLVAYHIGPKPPTVRHLIGMRRRRLKR